MSGDDARDEALDDAWARIVAGYDQQIDDADRVGHRRPSRGADDAPDEAQGAGADVETALQYQPAPWDDEGHYVPPPPPPLPRPRGAAGLAWAGVAGGPLVVFVAAALGWTLSTLLMSGCVLGFVGGIVFLIMSIDDDKRDGWDDGAQI
ncbi:MAG: hypothetical protein H0U47_05110 [Nocardioidaceae bacterium]|nr:hypothetical protein [Nocardioidaceae bacterium]